jgi:hypothetical protein
MIYSAAFAMIVWLSTQAAVFNFDGFTKNPIEHIIRPVDQPISVRAVKGTMKSQAGGWPNEAFVVFEMKGPLPSQKIWRTCPKKPSGHFQIKGVPDGEYFFKATAIGWQSAIGTIVVTKDADHKQQIDLHMALGV